MNEDLQYKVQRCAKLLAESPLADEIKQAVISHINEMTETQLDLILSSLEREAVELAHLQQVLVDIDAKHALLWESLEERQKAKADVLLDAAFKEATGQ